MCERIDNTTMQDIYECYQDIVKNAKILVFYVGKRSDEDIVKQINSAFYKNCSAADIDRNTNIKVLEHLPEPNVVIEDSDISQSRLVMGFNCQSTWRDDDYYAMLLCNEILGASPISKLMMNVREKLSLCYECSSVYNSARGAIFVTTGIDRENYDLASNAILAQMDDIKQGRVSEAELDAAKKSIFNVYSAVDDSQSAIERFYLGRLINKIDVDIDDFLSRINELTLDDVMAAAKKTSLHTVYFLRGSEDGEEDLFDE
jgi:predicted Zn-dependent peptidase